MTNWGEMSIPAHRFIAFDKETGEIVWFNGTSLRPDDTTYSTPFLGVDRRPSRDGVRLGRRSRLGLPTAHRQAALELPTFAPRLERRRRIVDDDIVYVGQSEENPDDSSMGAVAAINAGRRVGRHHEDGRALARKEADGRQEFAVVDRRPTLRLRRRQHHVRARCQDRRSNLQRRCG